MPRFMQPKRTRADPKTIRRNYGEPRVYSTPAGNRLNLAAICKQYGIEPSNFLQHQGRGWPAINNKKLLSEQTSRGDTGRGKKRELTFLESDLTSVLKPSPNLSGRFQLPDGRWALSTDAVRRELRISRSVLLRWNTACPYLGGKPFKQLAKGVRAPDNGLWIKLYAESDVVELKMALASAGHSPNMSGEVYILRADAALSLKLRVETLKEYEDRGILHRAESPRSLGEPLIWYRGTDIERIRALLDERRRGRRAGPRGECMVIMEVVKKYRWTYGTLKGYEKECPCLPDGKLIPEWYVDELTASGRLRRAYHVVDLDTIQSTQSRHFAGFFETPEGRRLNTTAAARMTGLSRDRLIQYARRCSLLPEGRLYSTWMRRPTRSKTRERTFHESDLQRLITILNGVESAENRDPNWQSIGQLWVRDKLTRLKERVAVREMLLEMASNGSLTTRTITRQYIAKNTNIQIRLCFDVREINNLLSGRRLADIAVDYMANQSPTSQKKLRQDEVPANGQAGQIRETRTRPSRKHHLQWKTWKDNGSSFGEIVLMHFEQTSVRVSREAIANAIRRLKD